MGYGIECSTDPKHTEAWELSIVCQFCPVCGAVLVVKMKACCKRWKALNANYCTECGAPLKPELIGKEIAEGSVEVDSDKKKSKKKHGGKK